MDCQPKTEPGLPPGFASRIHTNLNEMTVSDLVSKLRTAFRFDDFDCVEKVLVARDARLKAEIASLQEKIELERMAKIQAEEEVRKRNEECLKGKRAQECYEKLLKEVKKSGLAELNTTVEELRNKNIELLAQNCKLKELEKQWLHDTKSVAELRIRVRELEDERVELEASKKNQEDDRRALDELRRRNSDLEEALKKNLAENDNKSVIDELRAQNTRLLGEKRRLEALVKWREIKFLELQEKVVKLEDDVKTLMSVYASVSGENTEGEEPKADLPELKESNGIDVRGCNAGSDPFQKNEDTRHSLGAGIVHSPIKLDKGAPDASATGRSGSVTVIEIKDSDDDEDDDDQTHRRQKRNLSRVQTLEMLKRKISFSDTSSSLSDPPLNFRDITSNKKNKTEVDSPVLNSLPR